MRLFLWFSNIVSSLRSRLDRPSRVAVIFFCLVVNCCCDHGVHSDKWVEITWELPPKAGEEGHWWFSLNLVVDAEKEEEGDATEKNNKLFRFVLRIIQLRPDTSPGFRDASIASTHKKLMYFWKYLLSHHSWKFLRRRGSCSFRMTLDMFPLVISSVRSSSVYHGLLHTPSAAAATFFFKFFRCKSA